MKPGADGIATVEDALEAVGATVVRKSEGVIRFKGGVLPWRPMLILAGGEITLPALPAMEPKSSVRLSWLTMLGPLALCSFGWLICWLVRAPVGVPVFLAGGPVFVFVAGHMKARQWLDDLARQWLSSRNPKGED